MAEPDELEGYRVLRAGACEIPITRTITEKGGTSMAPALAKDKCYTIDDIYSLPEGSRAELIDGQIYYMAPPNRSHQTIVRELFTSINSYIKSKNGSCESFFAPFSVFLNEDKKPM